MTREEAIEIVKTQYSHDSVMKTALGMLIPELCESSDEIIRSAMIKGFNFLMEKREINTFAGTPIRNILAYLEKQKDAFENGRQFGIMQEQARLELELDEQKEQKPDDIKSEWWNKGYLEGRKNAHIPAKELGLPSSWDFQKEQKPDIELIQQSWYMEGYQDREHNLEPEWIVKTGEGGPRYEENPKYGQMLGEKQEPAECIISPPSDPFMFNLHSIIYNFGKQVAAECLNTHILDTELDEYVTDENVDKYIKEHISCLVKYHPLLKPAEWSEEDEKKIIFLERLIKYNVPEGQYGYKDGAVTKLGAIAMLKSLHPSWKPTAAQMKGLKFFLDFHRPQRNAGTANWKEFDAVESLYEQLKKL